LPTRTALIEMRQCDAEARVVQGWIQQTLAAQPSMKR
jgi:hypothetical protein